MDFLREYQVSILISCGLVSFILAGFAGVIDFHSVKKKMAMLKIEMSMGILMFSEAAAYLYNGDQGRLGFWMVRIAEFMVYVFTIMCVYYLCAYLMAVFMETRKFDRPPKLLRLGFVLSVVGILMVVISQFTGIYYYYDENNIYQRGPLFLLGVLFPFGTMLLLFCFVTQHRKLLNRKIFWSVALFNLLPCIAAVLQLFIYGISFIDVASWAATINLFTCVLIDQNAELVRAANTELASGLPNTFGYLHELERIIHFHDITEYNSFYFDIVRMGLINNKYGKKMGDEIICKYAKEIRSRLETDEIVGRLGGNYFVALIKKENTDRFLEMLKDVTVEIDFHERKEEVHVAAVAGGYSIETKHIAAGQILSNTADAVVYAKNVAHKPYVFLDQSLEKELERIRALEERTRIGLEKGEFEPFYQPKMDTMTNRICGAEALARWRKDGELVPPAEFIPIMEKNATICNLDFYILECVCKDLREWIDRGLTPVEISVNFSRKNLGNPILAEAISKVVEKYGVPKDLIQIEITETIDEYPLSYLVGVVEALQRYGMTVAIDDFGTGSSSIKLLKDVKFDVLKIDKSFVDYDNEKDKELLGDIIRMARNREIDTIAEGVEAMEQVEALKELGCYAIQGFVFDRPLEKSEYEKRLQM